jgi:bacterioferritin B
MLISSEVNKAINQQIGHEFGASLQYVAIAAYFDGEGLPALAKHFYRQALEEREHAMRFVRYSLDADATIAIPAIPAPQCEFGSAEDAVRLSLDWEVEVTRQINAIVDLAIAQNDHMTKNFLEWFIEEQREEVSSMDTLLKMIRRAGENGLLFVESYLARGEGPTGGHELPAGA